MKKKGLLIVGVTVLLALGGCSENKEETTVRKQEEQIEVLTHEKKELELLLENEKQKMPDYSTTAESNIEESNEEELSSLFNSFIHAQFEQEDKELKPLTTAKLYTILVDKAGERETSVSFKSTVKSVEIYQAESLNDTEAKLVGKIEIETKVGDFTPSRYQQLVECTAVKNSEGVFQIDTQILTNLAE